MHIDNTTPSGNAALDRMIAHIQDAFRPERKEQERIMLTGHRVKALVQDGRYSYAEAAKLLKLAPGQVASAHRWLLSDNARLNVLFDSEAHRLTVADAFMLGFINHEEACADMPRHETKVTTGGIICMIESKSPPKHTSGPWIIAEDYKDRVYANPSNYDDPEDGFICETGGNEANARLIAAAPELLAALEAIAAPNAALRTETWEQARAAITKATGA